jgi:hypothetical protein
MESAPWLTERELKALRRAGRKIPWGQIGELRPSRDLGGSRLLLRNMSLEPIPPLAIF